ncbi:MAG: hypothetical protein K2N85_08970 [Lachnospiraceae bacterium]|nr:hypothetical protein [Lachnospiraceae bacterium]
MYRKIKYKAVKGYMTLEACFIMPWIIFMFVFLIYASFYVYDKCVLFQDTYTLCLRGCIQKEEEGAVNYINAHMNGQFGKKYFGTDKVQGSAEQHGQEVKVYARCSVQMPFNHFLTMAKAGGWQIQTEGKAWKINPTKLLRRFRMVEKFL